MPFREITNKNINNPNNNAKKNTLCGGTSRHREDGIEY